MAPRSSTPKDKSRDVVPPATTSLSPRGGAKHRTMKKQILELLELAGPAGLTVDEIAHHLEVLKSRVQSWFSSTGKRSPEVEKLEPGRWRYVGGRKVEKTEKGLPQKTQKGTKKLRETGKGY